MRQVADQVGGIPLLSEKLHITRQAIYQWYHYGIPSSRVFEIESLSNGKLKASNLIKNIL